MDGLLLDNDSKVKGRNDLRRCPHSNLMRMKGICKYEGDPGPLADKCVMNPMAEGYAPARLTSPTKLA
ncbi:MAG: hypothetical protein ACLTT1_07930 [[Clostridium] scindens]